MSEGLLWGGELEGWAFMQATHPLEGIIVHKAPKSFFSCWISIRAPQPLMYTRVWRREDSVL